MKKERKLKLTQKYMYDVKIPEITDFQKEWIRKETAHYIFVEKDEKGKQICTCNRCKQVVDLPKTKHKDMVTCPVCKGVMEVNHRWRFANPAKMPETIDWIVIPRAIDSETLMLRYVVARRLTNGEEVIKECARMVFTKEMKMPHTFELIYDGENEDGSYRFKWRYWSVQYFSEYNMGNYRRWCCLPAKPYKPNFVRELKKLDGIKYLAKVTDLHNFEVKNLYIHRNISILWKSADLYEKMIKCGLSELVKKDFASCTRYGEGSPIEFNDKEKSLLKMLGINRTQLALLRENQSNRALGFIRVIPNITQECLDICLNNKISANDIDAMKTLGANIDKAIRYIDKTKLNAYEWLHYVRLLVDLHYDLNDETYLYPKNFRREDNRVTDEYDNRRAGESAIEILQSKLMTAIAKTLKENEELKEFFKGSCGLQVVVPESVSELRKEGRHLHNCLGTYGQRVSSGKTLIFFIRKIEEPDAPFVAMEYSQGRIIQCRFDHNESVYGKKDEKIINFAERLAKTLKENNILAA